MKKLILIFLFLPFLGLIQDSTQEMYKKGVDTAQYIPKGLTIGDQAPEIIAKSIDGRIINSAEILKDKNIVVLFYRGKWCPYCQKQLSNLNDSLKYITEKNAEIIVIGPENFENAEKTVDKTKADFILIPDTSMQLLKAFDVLFYVTKKYQAKINTLLFTDIAKNNGQKEARLPVPAAYIIGKDGVIIWRYFNYDYTQRASAREIIDHLK